MTRSNLYPQAIYFYSQAFEKATKSAIALYLVSYEKKTESETSKKLKDAHSHRLLSLTSKTATIFVDSDIRSYVKQGGKESDKVIQKAKNSSSISYLKTLQSDKIELISKYEVSVRNCYALYTNLKEEPFLGNEHPDLKILRELYSIPKSKYIKFNTLARILFPVLDGMDLYSRYPMDDIGNLNIAFLSRHEIRGACLLLGEIVEELVS